jgi:two-component system NtrC family sensor kinase
MYRARKIMIIGITLLTVVVVLVIWTTTGSLVRRARSSAENRDELQMQLLHAAKLASVGELATGIAHEINNPLAIVLATTGVIKDMLNPEFNLDAGSEDILKELDTVDAAVFRAREITRKLLDYGRKHQPRLVPCDLNHLLDEVLDGLKQRELAVKNIDISRRYEPGLPEVVVDPDQMRQVFLNFINNAGDAIEGSGMITISTRSEAGLVHVTITDSGHGITPGQLDKIFDPFFTTKEVGKGTGLGLSVSLSIVKSMGGSINVQSIPEVGSSFTVSLPLQPAERKNHDAKPESDKCRE